MQIKGFQERYDIEQKLEEYMQKFSLNKEIKTEEEKKVYLADLKEGIEVIKEAENKYTNMTLSILKIPSSFKVIINRKMLGNSVAKLMSDLIGKQFIYQEDYKYAITYNKNYSSRIPMIAKEKIFTVIDSENAVHEPYINCYELLRVDNELNTDYKLENSSSELRKMISNNKLFVLPGFSGNCRGDDIIYSVYTHYQQSEYCEPIVALGGINYWYDHCIYDQRIINYLTILFLKTLYLGRNLNESEIERIRIKYVELYKSGYDFQYYEDELYKIKDIKILEKNIDKNANL